jgi:predicted MFS family arabinose efflux permease
VARAVDAPKQRLFSGVTEILKDGKLRGALLTVLATGTLCGPLITFGPVLIKEGFHSDAAQFSVALGNFGIGGLLGALSVLTIEGRFRRSALSSWFALAYGVVVLCAGLVPWLWGVPVLMLLAGVTMSVTNTQANSLLQASAGTRRGQAASLFMLAMRGGMSVGSLITGLTAEGFGVRTALVLNGCVAVLAHLLIGRAWRRA